MNQAKEEELFCKRISELASRAYMRGICVYSDFLNLNESNLFFNTIHELSNPAYQIFGGYEEAERRVVCFYEDGSFHNIHFPISCIHISPVSKKYADDLTHRDFLGAILNLGIDRSKTGDILIQDADAYLFCKDEIRDFILESLVKVKHTQVICEKAASLASDIKFQVENVHTTVSSMRLDAMLAGAFRGSRTQLAPLISGGRVFVNGRMITTSSYFVKEGDIVSVRGMGRFRFLARGMQTKKGRYQITLEKYR